MKFSLSSRPASSSDALTSPVVPSWTLGAAVALLLAATLLHTHPVWNQAVLLLAQRATGAGEGRAAAVWASLSVLGMGLSMALVVLAIARTGPRLGRAMACGVPLCWLVTHGLKALFQAPRPAWGLPPEAGLSFIGEPLLSSYAMPSGHALTVFAVAWVLVTAGRVPEAGKAQVWKRRLAAGAWWLLAAGVALSRLAVGAHWPADVLAGAGLGLLCGPLAWWLGGRFGAQTLAADLPTEPQVWTRRLLAVTEAALALALARVDTGQPMALPMVGALVLMAAYSALSRWRHARVAAGADAAVARLVWPTLIAGLAMAVLLRQVEWVPLWQALRQTPAWMWWAVLLGLWGSYALRAERLRREWSTWGRAQSPPVAPLGFHDSLDIFLAHNAALVVLPMRAGEAGYPWLLNRRFGIPVAESVRSLVWLRLQDACVLGWLGLVCLAPGGWMARTLGGVAALGLAIGVVPWASRELGRRWPRWQGVQSALVAHRGDRLGWLLCASNWVLKLGVLGLALTLLSAAGDPAAGSLTPFQGFAAAVAGDLAVALPLQAPAGLGSYEAAIWAAGQWVNAHVPLAQLTGAALAVHLLSLACALFSFALYRVLTGVRQWLLPRASAQPLV